MFDALLYVALSALGVLWGFLGVTLAVKRYAKPEIILDFSDIVLDEFATNIEYQKKIYLVGGLLGQGIQQGLGLPKGRGKFKIEDAIAQLAGVFIQNVAQQAMKPKVPTSPEPLVEGLKKTLS